MDGSAGLADAFKQCEYPVVGHGRRNLGMLLEALEGADALQEADMYGKGKIIAEFEAKIAEYVGKPAAAFFPSGTMAQQIALRIWCDEKKSKRVAYHPLCHLEIHEEGGLKELHGIRPTLLGDADRLIRLEDVRTLGEDEDTACLLLELPQREIGGQLPPYEELEAIAELCRSRGIRLHLDGARLFEILPYYGKSAADICSLFDSVYVSFYKGLGGIAGAILAGEASFIADAKIWKRRHGGDLISLYPYIISSDYYFELRAGRMMQYYEEARELAALFNGCPSVRTVPAEPVSNMFHVHAERSKSAFESALQAVCRRTGIGLSSWVKATGEHSSAFEATVGDRYAGVPKDKLREAFTVLGEELSAR